LLSLGYSFFRISFIYSHIQRYSFRFSAKTPPTIQLASIASAAAQTATVTTGPDPDLLHLTAVHAHAILLPQLWHCVCFIGIRRKKNIEEGATP
jgi:hypothetical protein